MQHHQTYHILPPGKTWRYIYITHDAELVRDSGVLC